MWKSLKKAVYTTLIGASLLVGSPKQAKAGEDVHPYFKPFIHGEVLGIKYGWKPELDYTQVTHFQRDAILTVGLNAIGNGVLGEEHRTLTRYTVRTGVFLNNFLKETYEGSKYSNPRSMFDPLDFGAGLLGQILGEFLVSKMFQKKPAYAKREPRFRYLETPRKFEEHFNYQFAMGGEEEYTTPKFLEKKQKIPSKSQLLKQAIEEHSFKTKMALAVNREAPSFINHINGQPMTN